MTRAERIKLHKAQHEAGHALMARLMGAKIESVDLHRVALDPSWTFRVRMGFASREERVQYALVMAAGVCSSRLYRPHQTWGELWLEEGGSDSAQLSRLIHGEAHKLIVKEASNILNKYRSTLDKVVQMLNERGELTDEDLQFITPDCIRDQSL